METSGSIKSNAGVVEADWVGAGMGIALAVGGLLITGSGLEGF